MPHTIVIFGASGDLTSRKLVPAIYNLMRCGKLPAETRIVGMSRTPLSDEQWRAMLEESTRTFAGESRFDAETWVAFAAGIHYQPGDIVVGAAFALLLTRLAEIGGSGTATRVYYLATAPRFYKPAVEALGRHGMAEESRGARRIVVEKPFGTDLATAKQLNLLYHDATTPQSRSPQLWRCLRGR